MTPNPEVLDLARRMGEKARLAIFTNNGPVLKLHLGELFPEAAAIFAERYCSCEFAARKPDPASFLRLLEKAGVQPQDAWFIDDKHSNVEGARLAGLMGHHYRSPELLAAEAKSLGLID